MEKKQKQEQDDCLASRNKLLKKALDDYNSSPMNSPNMFSEDDGTDIMAKTMDFIRRVSSRSSPPETPPIVPISIRAASTPTSPDYYDAISPSSSCAKIFYPPAQHGTDVQQGTDVHTDGDERNSMKESSYISLKYHGVIDWLSLTAPLSKAIDNVLFDNNKDNEMYGKHTIDQLRSIKVQNPLTRTMTLSMLSFAKEMNNKQNSLLNHVS